MKKLKIKYLGNASSQRRAVFCKIPNLIFSAKLHNYFFTHRIILIFLCIFAPKNCSNKIVQTKQQRAMSPYRIFSQTFNTGHTKEKSTRLVRSVWRLSKRDASHTKRIKTKCTHTHKSIERERECVQSIHAHTYTHTTWWPCVSS